MVEGEAEKNKLFRDSIHGYIEIPEVIVSEIIDTPVFQRLRRIEQTSMRALYPSAHHDRFVHSLGVFHLGKMAYKGLIRNIKNQSYFKENEAFWKKREVCFQMACLLHDCGHAPMSHSFEYMYLNVNDVKDCETKKKLLLNSMLGQVFAEDERYKIVRERTQADVEEYFSDPGRIVPHEMVSAIVTSICFRDGIRKVLECFLHEELSECELQEDIIFIQRAIIGLPYRDLSGENYLQDSFKNCLISLLNGNFFDVDKLDYIVRDTLESGANNLSIDIPRILSALTLVETHHFDMETEVVELELNNSVYLTGHSKGNIADKAEDSECECALNLSGVHFVGCFQGEISADEEANTIKTVNREARLSGNERFNEFTQMDVKIIGKCKLTGRFKGIMDLLGFSETDKIEGTLNAKLSGTIKGTIIGHIDSKVSSRKTYEIGYMKNALSVIEDTLIARNRLYLWIYAHHKVTYNDYALRQGILYSYLERNDMNLSELQRLQKATLNFAKIMDIEEIFLPEKRSKSYLLSDDDLIHNMKQSLFDDDMENRFAIQWISRHHMHPVWKSYIEYNNFFSNLSSTQRKKLWGLLFHEQNTEDTQNAAVEANTREYDSSILKECIQEEECEFAWIKPAGFKLKEMDVSNIFIVLSDESVKRLKDVISQAKVTEQYVDESFFYLYTSRKLSPDEKLHLISSLKTKVKNIEKS